MKNIFSIVAIVLCFVVSSCSKSETIPDEEYVTVSFAMGGELDVTYSPMTKASNGSGMWGVQVFRIQNDTTYPYAYGVFTHYPDDITLAKGDTYNIIVDYIADADYSVIAGTTSMSNVCLEIPFNTMYWSKYNINEFKYTSSDYIYSLGGQIVEKSIGDRHLGETHKAFNNNTYNRYFGEVQNYSPAKDNKLTVNMLHFSSSLTVIVNLDKGVTVDEDIVLYFSKLAEKNVTFKFTKESDGTYKAVVPVFAIDGCANYYWKTEDWTTTISLSIGTYSDPDAYYLGSFEAVRHANIQCKYTITSPDYTIENFNYSYEDNEMENVNINL